VIGHCPTDDAADVDVKHDSQKQEAAPRSECT
jgi:hypothetical protein